MGYSRKNVNGVLGHVVPTAIEEIACENCGI